MNSTNKVLKAALVAISLTCKAYDVSATTLTFDDIVITGYHPITGTVCFTECPMNSGYAGTGYGGFSWSNFYLADVRSFRIDSLKNGMVSDRNVITTGSSGASIGSDTPFTFNSAYMTGMYFQDGDGVDVYGFLNGVKLYETTFLLFNAAPTFVTFDWTNITSVTFSFRSGPGVIFDNITVNEQVTTPVPEPEIYAILLAGLGLLGYMARRRKQQLAA